MNDEISVDVVVDEEELETISKVDVIEITPEFETYDGEYEITPLAFQQHELNTKDKVLNKNIKVKEIPFFETSNLYGNTVYIGSEV